MGAKKNNNNNEAIFKIQMILFEFVALWLLQEDQHLLCMHTIPLIKSNSTTQ